MSVGLVGLFAILATLFVASAQPQPTERVLNVGWAHQAHNLPCEAAALKMALSYYGIDTDELRLISFMSRDSRPPRFDTSGHIMRWVDPPAGFVANTHIRVLRYAGSGVYYRREARA